jgi:hypothetical protein
MYELLIKEIKDDIFNVTNLTSYLCQEVDKLSHVELI